MGQQEVLEILREHPRTKFSVMDLSCLLDISEQAILNNLRSLVKCKLVVCEKFNPSPNTLMVRHYYTYSGEYNEDY
jgi:predicted transcriptional regulator